MPFIEGVPTVVVQLDKPRTLGFTMGAIRRIQDRLGTLDVSTDGMGALLALPVYVWACMDTEGRGELSVDQVAEMVHPGNAQVISESITALMGMSSPEAAGAEATTDPSLAGPRLAAHG
jgi:hypothetical protein